LRQTCGVTDATAHIVALQEQRVLFARDDGRTLLLTVDHRSGIARRDLDAWYRRRTRLRLRFDGDPSLTSGVLHAARAAA